MRTIEHWQNVLSLSILAFSTLKLLLVTKGLFHFAVQYSVFKNCPFLSGVENRRHHIKMFIENLPITSAPRPHIALFVFGNATITTGLTCFAGFAAGTRRLRGTIIA